jgi:hypothetical protein
MCKLATRKMLLKLTHGLAQGCATLLAPQATFETSKVYEGHYIYF